MVKSYKTEVFKPILELSDEEKRNKVIDDVVLVDTAGFIPLKVKIQKMIESGIVDNLREDDFDADIYNELYLSEDFKITSDDDLEDVQRKIIARNAYIAELKAKMNAENSEIDKVTKEEDNKDTKTTESDS